MSALNHSANGPPFPIIVIGSPRSGTSMLHWSLCEHDALWGSEESEFLLPYARLIESVFDQARQFPQRNWLDAQGVDFNGFCAALGVGIDALYRSGAGGRHWIEQTPSNTWALPVIRRLLPRARFLYIHRDGRQVVESMKATWGWGFSKALRTWCDANRLALQFSEEFPAQVHRLAYEALVRNPAEELDAIWRFLGLEQCSASIHFIRDRAPINASPAHRHESSLSKLEPRHAGWSSLKRMRFRRLAGVEMRKLAYDID